MKKALISPTETSSTGYRIVEVDTTDFQVTPPLFWVDCEDTVTKDNSFYDSTTKTITELPIRVIPPVGGLSLDSAKVTSVNILNYAYNAAISKNITITTEAGISVVLQADDASRTTLQDTLNGLASTKVTPPGFYWKAFDNSQVAMTYNDLLTFASALFTQGWSAFQNLQAKKLLVQAATTPEAAIAITF